MKICTNANSIRKALMEMQPTKIAVAFIGEGWKTYINVDVLEEIIISPTLGSNPKAIEKIIAHLGISNVHFLDNLHAKIYLGPKTAMIGSANLSDNGLADHRLLEAGVHLTDSSIRQELLETFDSFKSRAKLQYPNAESKLTQLRLLTKQWQTSIWHRLNADAGKSPSLPEYSSDLDRIHIAWYESYEPKYKKDVIWSRVEETAGVEPDKFFSKTLTFLEEDEIKVGDWILCWHSRKDGFPYQRGDVSWMHVHHVVPESVDDSQYTKLVGQAKSLSCPPPPFDLDSKTKEAIRNALASGKFPELLSLDNSSWKLSTADAVVPKLLNYVKRALRNT
jgi:hypothetical protein